MEDPHASNVPLVEKESSSSAVILPAQTLLSSVHYRSCNNSTNTNTETTATTTGSQQGADIANATATAKAAEPVPLLHQLQTLPLQKPNDLKQCNANYG